MFDISLIMSPSTIVTLETIRPEDSKTEWRASAFQNKIVQQKIVQQVSDRLGMLEVESPGHAQNP